MRQLAVIVGDIDTALAAELLGVADAIVPGISVIARDAAAVAELEERLGHQLPPEELDELRQRGRRTDARAAYTIASRGIAEMRSATRAAAADENRSVPAGPRGGTAVEKA
jgi:hypothetical protein